MKKLLIIMSLLVTYNCFAEMTCKTTGQTELCFNDRVDFIVSKNCREYKCDLFNHNVDSSIFKKPSPFGNPTQRFCSEIKGTIFPVTINHLGSKYKVKLCKEGKSYVDLGTLYLIYMQKYAK